MKRYFLLFLTLSLPTVLSAQTQFTKDVQALSPLGFWTLNGNANDSSGHGLNGNANPAVFFTNLANCPVEPQAAVFSSASSGLIKVPASPTFNLGALHAMTAMLWVRTVNLGRGFQALMSASDVAAANGWVMAIDNGDIGPQGGGRFFFGLIVNNNPVLAVETTTGVANGNWILLSATYDGSGSANGVHLFINGAPAATTTVVDTLGNASNLNSTMVSIGGLQDGSNLFEGNIAGAAIFGTALTPLQNQQLADDANTAKSILSQFAFGGGWYSAIYFSNTTTGDVSFTVNFTGDDGNPLSVPSVGGSSKTVTIPAGGTAVIEAPNSGLLSEGYVTANLPAGVTGYGVFRQSIPGDPDQEAVVPFAIAGGSTEYLVYDETNGLTTAAAIVNPSNVTATVTITVTDDNGTVVATSSSLSLPPFNKTEAVMRALPGLSQIVGTRGIVKFTVSTGSVAVLGLRVKGIALTSMPSPYFGQVIRFIGTL